MKRFTLFLVSILIIFSSCSVDNNNKTELLRDAKVFFNNNATALSLPAIGGTNALEFTMKSFPNSAQHVEDYGLIAHAYQTIYV